jgi:hypothetical protein
MLYCRRGKDSNGDVDLILSHPEELKNQGFLRKLVDHLMEKGKAHIFFPVFWIPIANITQRLC